MLKKIIDFWVLTLAHWLILPFHYMKVSSDMFDGKIVAAKLALSPFSQQL